MYGKPLLELHLRAIDAPACATPGASVYVLLPTLEELVGVPGFGSCDSILIGRPARAARYAAADVPQRLLH